MYTNVDICLPTVKYIDTIKLYWGEPHVNSTFSFDVRVAYSPKLVRRAFGHRGTICVSGARNIKSLIYVQTSMLKQCILLKTITNFKQFI